MRSTTALICLWVCRVATSAARSSGITTTRYLEDVDFYMNNYNIIFDKCIRSKIPQENDGDDYSEGNQYFYNGAYRSQSKAYASFFLCDNDSDTCDSCDRETAYVTELEEFLQSYSQYVQNYCTACQQQCRRRRHLEDEAEEEEEEQAYYNVDCDSCYNQCTRLLESENDGSYYDETQYLECNEAFQDDDGMQYYSRPTCQEDGSLVIGLFYDDECTVKKNGDQFGYANKFAYDTFVTIENMCTSCSDNEDNGDDLCDGFAEEALQCYNGQNINGNVDDSEMRVCRTYAQVSKEWQYAAKKKPSKTPAVVFGLFLVGLFFFLSYTYYVRHARMENKQQQQSDYGDGKATEPSTTNTSDAAAATGTTAPSSDYAVMT